MENLPTEIIEFVFHPLSKKEDIENCFNVNSKWRHIIENMSINKTKILVVGGHLMSKTHDAGLTNLIEIIDLINTELKTEVVVDENGLRGGAATGGILWNQPVICGGYDSDGNTKPNVSIIGAPKNCFEVMIPRKFSSSVVLNKLKLWVTGGISDPQNAEMSTEIISLDQTPVPGPDLPFGVNGHSMVHVNPTTVYFIGGSQNKDVDQGCDNTWIFDPTNNFLIKAGPSLKIARLDHTCSKMRIKGKIYLVVAGGHINMYDEALYSVEILDTTSPNQGWQMGANLPLVNSRLTLTSSPTEKGILMISGSDLYELSGDSVKTLEWKILEQKLQNPRYGHLSFSISNDIAAILTSKSLSR